MPESANVEVAHHLTEGEHVPSAAPRPHLWHRAIEFKAKADRLNADASARFDEGTDARQTGNR